jgi:hypothetical protein
VTTALSGPQLTLTDDQLQVAATRVGVQSLPIVLNVRPRHDDLATAVDAATGELTARGLIRHGVVSGELADQLHILQRPDRELALRLVTPQGMVRMTVVRRGGAGVWARRVGNDVTLSALSGVPGLTEVTRALLEVLPAAPAAEIVPVGAPLDAMAPALNGTHDSAQLSDRIRGLGAEPRAALLLGTALAGRQAFAEITHYALDADRVTRAPGAVGIFYTKRGRIVGAPSASPSGQLWTTLKGGSDHAVRQAVGQLVELSSGRWEDF